MRQALDPSKLKSIYDKVSSRYDFQHALVTLSSDNRGRKMVIEHSVKEGDAVLDAGAGTGSTALMAAQKTGPSGKVVLFDLSEGMLAEAKTKAEASGVASRMEFRTGDMSSLPFSDDTFDVVLSTYSLCPLGDPAKGARELYRVAKPGGRVAVAHSTDPANPFVRWLAEQLERIVWRIPGLSLGCRSVAVTDALRAAGGEILFEATIGIPLWPFKVLVVRKPGHASQTQA